MSLASVSITGKGLRFAGGRHKKKKDWHAKRLNASRRERAVEVVISGLDSGESGKKRDQTVRICREEGGTVIISSGGTGRLMPADRAVAESVVEYCCQKV